MVHHTTNEENVGQTLDDLVKSTDQFIGNRGWAKESEIGIFIWTAYLVSGRLKYYQQKKINLLIYLECLYK